MSRRVKRSAISEILSSDENSALDWTRLPNDAVVQIFSCLNYRDRASLSSTCNSWRAVGRSPCLWQILDLRSHKFKWNVASSLASRCQKLEKIWFRGHESAEAVIKLQAKNLRNIAGECCGRLTDTTLCALAGRHVSLQSLQIGLDFCQQITSDAIKTVAICCPNLQKLRLTGLKMVDAHAINALAEHCINLNDVGFVDCVKVDEAALGNVTSLRLLSVAGFRDADWATAVQHWAKLPHLIGLDVSRTFVNSAQLLALYSSLPSLKALYALNCEPASTETDATVLSRFNHKGKVLLLASTNMLKLLATLLVDNPEEEFNVFLHRRDFRVKDKNLDAMFNWLEWVISCSLLYISEYISAAWDAFLLNQGTSLLLSFMQSCDVEVQERAVAALAAFVVADDEDAIISTSRAQAVMRQGGIPLLLNLARSWREGLQSEAAQAITTLTVSDEVAKAVADEGGIGILTNLARSANRLVGEEAAEALWNFSAVEEHKGAIAEAGGVKALVDLIFRWSGSADCDGVLEHSAAALANLATDDKCSVEIASVGGVNALTMLAETCEIEGVQEQAARALANLAAHGDNNAAVGHEEGAI